MSRMLVTPSRPSVGPGGAPRVRDEVTKLVRVGRVAGYALTAPLTLRVDGEPVIEVGSGPDLLS